VAELHTTEIHRQCSPLFNPALPEEAKPLFRDKLIERFRYVDERLADKAYLMGSDFTVADGYLFVVARWAPAIGLRPSSEIWRDSSSR
jgi:glutathione S-transferase